MRLLERLQCRKNGRLPSSGGWNLWFRCDARRGIGDVISIRWFINSSEIPPFSRSLLIDRTRPAKNINISRISCAFAISTDIRMHYVYIHACHSFLGLARRLITSRNQSNLACHKSKKFTAETFLIFGTSIRDVDNSLHIYMPRRCH